MSSSQHTLPQHTLHIIAALDGYGLSRQLELLVARQLCAGQRICVVALRGDRRGVGKLRERGADVRVLDRRWRRDPFVAVRLIGELRRSSADVLHVWGQSALDYVQSVRLFAPTMPTFVTLPNQTLLNSQSVADIVPGVELPNAELPNDERAKRQVFLAEQELPADSVLIAVAGPLVRSQRIDEAIWYFELVRTLDENARLLIFGDGPDRHRLERFARLTSEPRAIRFLGDDPAAREVLPEVDLFWHTAEADETIPLALLEAMAAGVPVVANDGAGCRRAIRDGENGHLVPELDRAVFARQTRKILHDQRHAQQLGKLAAQTVIEEFSVDAMTAAYADRYLELTSS